MSALSNQDQIKLAKALANTSKEVRDKTVSELGGFFSSLSKLSLLEMRKLWKALYFCLWLSDKAPIQQELAKSLAHLLQSFKKKKLKLMYVKIFYRNLLEQWGKLDQYRINKFYSLVRYMLRETILMLTTLNWPVQFSKDIFSVLESEILTKQPNGLRFHIADIFLEEIYEATEGNISTDHFILCLQPFLVALGSADDKVYQERLSKKIFSTFLSQYARENKSNPATVNLFLNVNTATIQKLIFEVASNSEITKDSYRQKIYALHKEFQLKTKKQFITSDSNDEYNNKSDKTVKFTNSSSSSSTNNTNHVDDAIIMTENVDNSNAIITGTTTTKKTEKKRKSITIDPSTVLNAHSTNTLSDTTTSTTTSTITGEIIETDLAISSTSTSTSSSVTANTLPDDLPSNSITDSEPDRKANKKQKKKHTKAAPIESTPLLPGGLDSTNNTSIETVSDRSIEAVSEPVLEPLPPIITDITNANHTTKKKKNKENTTAATTTTTSTNNTVEGTEVIETPPSFILSKKFSGAKPGYFFKNDKQGTGYYIDSKNKNSSKNNSKTSITNDANKTKNNKKVTQQQSQSSNNSNINNQQQPSSPTPPPQLEFRKVHFGALQSKDYQSSVEDLRSATNILVSTPPGKSALKVKDGSLTGSPKKKKKILKVGSHPSNNNNIMGGLFRSSSTGTL